jgi:uncharacterized membrane protein
MPVEYSTTMAREARTRTVERAVAFTDATVAIALTFLMLPLLEAVNSSGQHTVTDVLADERDALIAFVVSFMLITGYWRSHRRLYELLIDYDDRLLTLNSVWLLAIVFIPFPTAMLTKGQHLSQDSVALYLASMVAVLLLQLAQVWWIHRHPQLSWTPDVGRVTGPAALRNLVIIGCMLVALCVDAVSPLAAVISLSLIPVALQVARLLRPRSVP